jgi:two-component system response regulator HydG
LYSLSSNPAEEFAQIVHYSSSEETRTMVDELIILVDDDVLILRSLGQILRFEGYVVETAETGGEAMEKIEEDSPDLAILDYKLPDTTGAELLKILSRRFPGILKIILTGYPADVDREEVLALGAVECLYKPIQPDKLVTIIKETLGQP